MEINAEECLKRKDNFLCQENVESVLVKGGERLPCAPRFSIVIPTWKRIETLKDTVESALTQEGDIPYDIIVVEDNPEPDSGICRYLTGLGDARIRYWRNSRNLGLVGNFNRAVSLADAEYAVLVHDDDFLFPGYLKKMSGILDRFPDADIVCPAAVKWREYLGEPRPSCVMDDAPARIWNPDADAEPFCRFFAPTGVTFRKSAFMESGGFDHESGPSTDLYYIVRSGKDFRYYRYDKPMFVYRWAENESMKFTTRMDFLHAGLPLRRLLLERRNVPSPVSKAILEYYCWKSVESMKKDFPDENIDLDGLVLPGNRMEVRVGKFVTDVFARFLMDRRRLRAKKI